MPTEQRETREKLQHQRLAKQKIAYILGQFPLLSETFVLQEILELERQGLQVHIFSLFKPSISKDAEVVWNGQASVTYLSHYSKLIPLIYVIRYFLKAPIRFTRTCIAMVGHYRLKFLIGCRVLLFSAFLAAQFEYEDIIHMHAHFAWEATSVAQFTHLLTGIPYSFTAHANDIYLSSKSALAYKVRMARFVVVCNIYNQQYLKKLVDPPTAERIHCIYYGLNLALFPSNANVGPTPGTVPLILAVSRLVEKKGLIYLVSACRMLKDQGYDFLCRIVGEGPQRRVLEQQIRELTLTDCVELLGAAAHKQVIDMYQQATIATLPCIIASDGDRDGIPNALIEACYMGVPVVSTPVAGIPELISEEVNGLLVPPRDSAALASALARLLDDPLLHRRLAFAGRETVLEHFDLAQNAQRLMRLFYPDLGE